MTKSEPTSLLVIRHGPTSWNVERRIQGETDIELSEAGSAQVSGWHVPHQFENFEWVCSPLRRTRQTAALLGCPKPSTEARLREMSWGAWEGSTLAELRSQLGDEMQANEQRGLDFRPPGGESPRDVQARVRPWLAEIAATSRPTIAVTHKGVIRALLALATDWDMLGKAPVSLDWSSAHLFHVTSDSVRLAQPNIALQPQ